MSEEEKKAIEELKKTYKFLRKNQLNTNVWLTLDIHNLGILLNLIEKQQKEIKKLIEDYIVLMDNSIPKFKIREKIDEIHNKGTFDAEIVLRKLLGE